MSAVSMPHFFRFTYHFITRTIMSAKNSLSAALSFLSALILLSCGQTVKLEPQQQLGEGVYKVKDLVIYRDSNYFSSFPSVVKTDDGEYLVAFRRAPERALFGEKVNFHVDANAYYAMVRSKNGLDWSDAKVFFAHPFGGIQDPCMIKLNNGDILCEGYLWSHFREDGLANLKEPYSLAQDDHVFAGGFFLRSKDNGNTWEGPFNPPASAGEIKGSPFGGPMPAYNRGALCQGANGNLYWAVASDGVLNPHRSSNHLFVSSDNGETWTEKGVIASDPDVTFNEASMYETPAGDLVTFIRTDNFGDQACIARSKDGGETFTWQSMGFQGHPLNALRLPDNRVLLTYGYRHEPYGIRARILNAECTDFETAPEYVLRDDGAGFDLGYSWPVLMDDNHVLVVYYMSFKDDPTRQIQGTILQID